ncbi:DnaT-like ssDNA-binding domain-containing protein [Serratia grimesii]|uniref:DnaT-like ssDNA-binding domain-containing protein n=1 Tax=Serratia grimesii TaxID=82995 RepID=UPI00217A938A|nr:DnaT-like ssDNA-binding domain-containing protein [Serratia grimesii]CAI0898139.1 Primosomal protein I [Serratia grimesii]
MANPLAKTKANNEPYRKVKITMWNDPSFRALSPLPPSGQSLFVYLLTGPFTGIIPGLFKAGRAALSEELGWDVEAFDLALGEALSLGMVKADTQARVFWLPNAAKHNPPTSVNVIKSWVRAFELLPECDLKYEALESLRTASHGVSGSMGLAFDKAFALANPLAKDKANSLPRPFQKAVSSKQILKEKPLSLAGVSEISPEGQTPPMDEPPLWDDQDDESPQFGKFLMSASWQPSPDFQRQAVLWNKKLEGPAPGYTPEELASFTAFWKAEGRVYHQTQWEQKFADSVLYERQAAAKRIKHSGGLNATRNATAGATAQQQVRAARNAERERQGLAPLGDDGRDLRQPLGEQERGGTIHDLGPDDFAVHG